MTPLPWWATAGVTLFLAGGMYGWGYSNGVEEVRAHAASAANTAWVERAELAGRLAASDQQLANSQALIMQGVAIEVTKREVIYRDRIKDPAVAKCVVDSGLLELIDASHGVTGAKR